MAEIKKLVKRREVKKNGVFDMNKIYSNLKSEINSRGFDYTEKERSIKQLKKGDLYRIVMDAERKFDAFVKFHFLIDITGEHLRHGKVDEKVVDMGDLKVVFSCWMEFDYLNKWNATALNKFLLHIYMKYVIKNKIENFYESKCVEDFNYFHDLVKDLLE